MVRESQRYIYDQEWLKKGKNPCFDFIAKQQPSESDNVQQSADSIKQMLITNQLLSILLDVSQILRSLRYKLNLITENNVKEMKYWESHLDEELMQPSIENNDDILNTDELVKDKLLDQNITQTEHEMIGDIFNFSKNILENVQTDGDNKSIPDDELNTDLDGATDLFDFITSTGKECDQKDLSNSSLSLKKEFDNNLDFGLPNTAANNLTNLNSNNRCSFEHAIDIIKNEPLDDNFILDTKSTNSICNLHTATNSNQTLTQQLNNLPIKKPPTLEEKLLEHINNVHLNLMKKLELAERKIVEIENECRLHRTDFNGLKQDLVDFKDSAKDLYRDIQNANRFTMI